MILCREVDLDGLLSLPLGYQHRGMFLLLHLNSDPKRWWQNYVEVCESLSLSPLQNR